MNSNALDAMIAREKSLREETEGKLQMLLSLRENGLTSLFKEVRAFKELLTLLKENLKYHGIAAKILTQNTFFRKENSAQRGSFWPDIPADIRPKTSVRPSKSWKNKHYGTDIPRGRP